MDVSEALRTRHSTRSFSARPVPDDVIEAILLDAREAPSWSNTQPWRVAVATGATCDALRQDFIAASQTRLPTPDVNQIFTYPPGLQARRRETGFGLYQTLGIAREDSEARARQFERNHAMFDAPAAVFLFAHQAMAEYAVLDAGCFLMAMLLSATSHGVQSCAQAVLASYPDLVRARYDVGEEWRLLCGVALGYEDGHVVNTFRPARAPLSDIVLPRR
jgi:nitroreductase